MDMKKELHEIIAMIGSARERLENLIVLHAFGSIGIGTILSAIPAGNEVRILTKHFKPALNKAMGL